MRRFLDFIKVASLPIIFFSCASSPKAVLQPKDHIESTYEADASEAIALAVPPAKEKNFFSGVSKEAVQAVENGSPESINKAYSLLRKDSSLYTDNEKILLNVATSLMSILWRSENVSVGLFDSLPPNPYSGAIDSARQGIYDESTGNSDFLTLVLPSLVLVISETRSDYYEKSFDSLTAALKINENSVLANYLLGSLFKRQKKYKEAYPYFQKAREYSKTCVETNLAFADINYRISDYNSALSISKSILEENPVYVPALKLCALSCFAMGDLDESELYVAKVLQQEPENSSYLLFRAKILVEKKDYIRAASLLDVYARADSQNREYLVLRTKVQKDWNKNMSAASATIEKALLLYPDDEEIILTAAFLAAETGMKINQKSAGELASLILQKDEKNVDALQIKIADLIQQKKWSEAYSVSSSLIRLKNSPKNAIFTHISICLSSGKKDEAWNLIASLYEHDPKDEEVLQTFIKVLISTDRNARALKIIEQTLPSANSRLKSFLYYQKSFISTTEDAILLDLRSSLTANPRNKDALFRLYQIYFNKKEYRKAQYYLKQVVSLSPADESLLKLNSELEILLSK
ncbi:hypothetical protein HRO26_07810 [Treponema pectinovorum]|uniref:tetratricopeptide repeat protein n=1 Tax=Treponema pectinovorum TaxID=164 RepID=UPI003D92C097